MRTIKKTTLFILILVFLFTAICGCSAENNPEINPTSAPTAGPTSEPPLKSDIDYSDKANWAYYAQGEGDTGAYLDAEGGTLRVPDIDVEEYSSSMFPEGVYHLYDYQFFFRNLQENVELRASNYLAGN